VDNCSCYCHAIPVGKSIKGIDVVEVLEASKSEDNLVPKRIQVDNGSEFISKNLDNWAYENNVALDYSRPGKPTDNPFIEWFNGSSGTSAWTHTGSCLWKMPTRKSIIGWTSTTASVRMTPQEFIEKEERQDNKRRSLPGAPLPEGMYFAAAEHPSTALEIHTFTKRS